MQLRKYMTKKLMQWFSVSVALWRVGLERERSRWNADRVLLANIAEGIYPTGNITKKADAAVSTKYLLCKIGSDADHIATCGSADTPIGVMTDEAEAAEDLLNVFLLGSGAGTTKMIASAAILQGALLEPAANGKVQTLGGGVGTHHVVGKALNAASADGDVIEVNAFYFLRVI